MNVKENKKQYKKLISKKTEREYVLCFKDVGEILKIIIEKLGNSCKKYETITEIYYNDDNFQMSIKTVDYGRCLYKCEEK